jgi:hypothetical protein
VAGSAVDDVARITGTGRRSISLSEEQVVRVAEQSGATADHVRVTAADIDITESSLASELARATEPLAVNVQARRQAVRDACDLYDLWQATQDPEQLKTYAAAKLGGRPVIYVASVREAYQALANADEEGAAGTILRVGVCAMVA